jgi:hypothetical protein
MKGAINHDGGVTVSLLISMKISKGQSTKMLVKLPRLDEDIKGAINHDGGVTVSLLISMKMSKGQSTTLVV